MKKRSPKITKMISDICLQDVTTKIISMTIASVRRTPEKRPQDVLTRRRSRIFRRREKSKYRIIGARTQPGSLCGHYRDDRSCITGPKQQVIGPNVTTGDRENCHALDLLSRFLFLSFCGSFTYVSSSFRDVCVQDTGRPFCGSFADLTLESFTSPTR